MGWRSCKLLWYLSLALFLFGCKEGQQVEEWPTLRQWLEQEQGWSAGPGEEVIFLIPVQGCSGCVDQALEMAYKVQLAGKKATVVLSGSVFLGEENTSKIPEKLIYMVDKRYDLFKLKLIGSKSPKILFLNERGTAYKKIFLTPEKLAYAQKSIFDFLQR